MHRRRKETVERSFADELHGPTERARRRDPTCMGKLVGWQQLFLQQQFGRPYWNLGLYTDGALRLLTEIRGSFGW